MKDRDTVFLCLFFSIILFFGVGIFVFPKQSFSQKENRPLAEAPRVSLSTLLDGEYFKRLGDFYSDHFPLRDSFTAIYALSELSLAKSQVNDIVIGTDGVLASREKKSSDISEALKKLEQLSAKNTCVYIPPSSAQVFSSSLPQSLQREINSQASSFSQDKYYKTDHHWTSEGAYLAYTEICDMLGVTAFEENFFEKTVVSNDFRGTAYARSCLPKWLTKPDAITLYRYDGDDGVEVFCHDLNSLKKGFYEMSALDGADKYRVFLGGNYAHLSIKSKNSKPTLLLVKDSFANSVVPFLALHFDIEMIDPRYCSREYLEQQLVRGDIDRTLFLLSAENLSKIY